MTNFARIAVLSLLAMGLGTAAAAQSTKAATTSKSDACTAAQTKQAQADETRLKEVEKKDDDAKAAYNRSIERRKKADANLADATSGKAGAPPKGSAEAEIKASERELLSAQKALGAADDEFQKAFTVAQKTKKCRPSK